MTETKKPVVFLTWNEVSVGLHISALRHTESIRMKLRDNHGYTGRDIQDNLYGVLGEMAFAKITGRYFPMTVNNFKDADVGDKWQIRTVGSNKNRSLIVRYDDPNDHFYALMYIERCEMWAREEDCYKATFKGWTNAKDAKQAKYLTDFGYTERPKVFKVPDSSLRMLAGLPS
jgi:hypothetical protein